MHNAISEKMELTEKINSPKMFALKNCIVPSINRYIDSVILSSSLNLSPGIPGRKNPLLYLKMKEIIFDRTQADMQLVITMTQSLFLSLYNLKEKDIITGAISMYSDISSLNKVIADKKI